MKNSICILGAGQFGKKVVNILNTDHFIIRAFGDNNHMLYGKMIGEVPVLSVKEAILLKPEYLFIAVSDFERSNQLKKQALEAGFRGKILELREYTHLFDVRDGILFQMADRIKQQMVTGSIAELGVYRGDFSRKLNLLFPERQLYLFDTFEGFDKRDLYIEDKVGLNTKIKESFSDTSVELVIEKLPFPEKAIVCKGYFPDTTREINDIRYAMVSLDADLYSSIYAGLCYFWPRMSQGGVIMLHDYDNQQFPGVRKAVEDFEAAFGSLPLIPICDLHGTAIIVNIYHKNPVKEYKKRRIDI